MKGFKAFGWGVIKDSEEKSGADTGTPCEGRCVASVA
jgi:hypothetical protein